MFTKRMLVSAMIGFSITTLCAGIISAIIENYGMEVFAAISVFMMGFVVFTYIVYTVAANTEDKMAAAEEYDFDEVEYGLDQELEDMVNR